jgi:SAM-dependent methyltransferase
MRKPLFTFWQGLRYRRYLALLDPQARTLLDVGCMNDRFVRAARNAGYEASGVDIEHDLASMTASADVITCFQVLEHTRDPVAAIKNLAGLYRRQLLISVPYEPWFSFWRLSWEPEHLWAVTPAALRLHLGPPAFEARIILGRYYVASWTR